MSLHGHSKAFWDGRIILEPGDGFRSLVGSNCAGKILRWKSDWIDQVQSTLGALPRRFIDLALPVVLFPGDGLRQSGQPKSRFDALTLRVARQGRFNPLGPNYTYLVALDKALFDEPPLSEDFLRAPLLTAVLVEELAHVWDFRLEIAGSAYSSCLACGTAWRHLAPSLAGRRKPFDIENRKPLHYLWAVNSAEDWASAVVWYVLRREELRQKAPAHYDFADRLFRKYRIKCA